MEYRGLLRIEGVIDLKQFWQTGKSDADTVKITVDPSTSFTFQSAAGKITRTQAFAGAWIKCGKANNAGQRKPDFVISKQNLITVRLQGIDAPELHYPTTVTADLKAKGKRNGEFRQRHGGRAAEALRDYIASFVPRGTEKVHCHFESFTDRPTNACDSHGRFVGDVFVGLSAGGESLNKWLVENGWAYPLFYESMRPSEIDVLIQAWKGGRNVRGRAGRSWHAALLPFGEENRIERDYKIPGYPQSDTGRVNYPKIFRRQAVFWIRTVGPLSPAGFYDMLKRNTKKEHDYLLTHKAFEKLKGKKPKKWQRLVDYVGRNGRTKFTPIALVFKEEPSTLYRGSCTNPSRVTRW
jgi:endonuclease YncB( thermonuclease family)